VSEPRRRSSRAKRLQIAQILAFVALVLAFVGALGPADPIRTTYSWPPRVLEGRPARLWYTPLLVARQRPETISAVVPCSLPPPLPDATQPVAILATARSPERVDGLAVVRTGDRATFSIGGRVFAHADLRPGTDDCAVLLSLGAGRFQVEDSSGEVQEGGLATMPVVTGLFSALDLRQGGRPSIAVTTAPHAVRTRFHQTLAWVLGALAAFAALLLVAVEGKPRRASIAGAARRAVAAAHPADAVVALVLLTWWIVSPAFWDDGWTIARQSGFESSRGFSNYYDTLAANWPLGYWLEWLQHWLAQSWSGLIFLRMPALLSLAVTWLLCRAALARVTAGRTVRDSVPLWALAAAFLVGGMAWAMTLRPEPTTALLATAVLVCAIRFREHPSAGPVAAAAVLVPLALTAHQAGVVTLAPLLVVAPDLWRWARERVAVAGTLLTCGLGIFVGLFFVGSDLDQRRTDAQLTLDYGTARASWHHELGRYAQLDQDVYGTPVRRLSVALMFLAILSLLLSRRRGSRGLLDLPATALALTPILLLATPTRHPFHFGALLGLVAVAVAVAAETARLREDANESERRAWPYAVLAATGLTAAWCWSPRPGWGPLDLRTLDWTPGFERVLPTPTLAILLPGILLVGGVLLQRARGLRGISAVAWRVASWTAPVLAIPIIVLTVGVLVADAAKTDGWTLTTQNLRALAGDLDCGVADDAFVATPESVQPARAVTGSRGPGWTPPLPVNGLPAFALGPTESGIARTPWLDLPAGDFGLLLAGTPLATDRLWLEWGDRDRRVLQSDAFSADTGSELTNGIASWRLYAADDLPARAPDATSVRVVLRSDVGAGSALAVTAPVTYGDDSLARHLGMPTLVIPPVVTYVPCVEQPQLSGGVVAVPRTLLTLRFSAAKPLVYDTSPFQGLLDLYPLLRLPLVHADPRLRELVVFEVDDRIPGAALAPPSAASS
jgi:Mycobacterial cell wall arabinan synthesis protein